MTSSLVGSEMCIRDSTLGEPFTSTELGSVGPLEQAGQTGLRRPRNPRSVSYTHLTLPTICSV
eukprot:12607622-Prorocentrum_lima.AAC.1